jgi:hypothetical protein
MFPVTNNALPLGSPGTASSGAAAQVPPAYGSSGLASVMALQLPTAVAASGSLVAFQPNPPNIPKPLARQTPTNQSLSQLATQFIAQTSGVTSEELQIFMPPPSPPAGQAAAYLADMRVALGDLPDDAKDNRPTAAPPLPGTNSNLAPFALKPSIQNLMVLLPSLLNQAGFNLLTNGIMGDGGAPIQVRQAPGPLVAPGKKTGIGEARGANAYRVSTDRNFMMAFSERTSAVV